MNSTLIQAIESATTAANRAARSIVDNLDEDAQAVLSDAVEKGCRLCLEIAIAERTPRVGLIMMDSAGSRRNIAVVVPRVAELAN